MRHGSKLFIFTLAAMATGIALGATVFQIAKIGAERYARITPEKISGWTLASEESGGEVAESEPQKYYFLREDFRPGNISARSFLVGDVDTGEVIFSENPGERLPIASVTKLVTASVASEVAEELDTAVVSKKARDTYGSNGGLKVGQKIKVSDLLYPLLLESSNDAGEVLAERYGRDFFIKKMNQFAAKLQMQNTFFSDPSGLSPENQSTAEDLFRLAGHLKSNYSGMLSITAEKSRISGQNRWFNTNQLLGTEGYMGGKTGYTDKALQTGVFFFSVPLAEAGERNIALIILKSRDRLKDTKNILSYLKKNVYYGGASDAKRQWVLARTDLPEIYERDYVTLVLGGDIMLDRGVRGSVAKNFGGDYSKLFENLPLLKKADITFANLEGPASDRGKDRRNLYSFRMDPAVLPALRGAGVSIVSVANNHAGDWGEEALSDTLTRLSENEILYVGGGKNRKEAEMPAVVEKYGIKIGFLAFSDVGPEWLRAGENSPGILLANDPRLEEIVRGAAGQVDHLVVSIHFGEEYKKTASLRQERLARRAIDAGAKLVIGHHPHVTQDFETYKDGFIAYSLGNFIFDQGFSEETMRGLLLEIKLWKDGQMSIRKNTIHLNEFFQPEKVILGKEEKLKLENKIAP